MPCCNPDFTKGGTANGAQCVFPFYYKGVAYYNCTTVDYSVPWCSVTTSYQKKWGECIGENSHLAALLWLCANSLILRNVSALVGCDPYVVSTTVASVQISCRGMMFEYLMKLCPLHKGYKPSGIS